MDLRIIPRAEWGARHPNGFGPRALPAREAWLHHSVTIAPDLIPPFDDDYAAIRTLEQIGQDRFGGGISYTRLITPAGLVFEGHDIDRVGSHTAGHNTIAAGYCLVGNYSLTTPTDAQLIALAWVLQHDHTHGWLDQPRLDGGHRDLKATDCPGQHAYTRIGTINALAAGPPIQEDTMLTAQDVDAIAARIFGAELTPPGGAPGSTRTVRKLLEDIQGYGLRTQHTEVLVAALVADVAALKARPAAEVDEAALAAELVARGIGGITAAELVEILAAVRLVPGPAA